MINLEVDVFKHYDSFTLDIFIRSGKNTVIKLLSQGFFIALEWESTGDKLVFHTNTLDCCESNIL